MAFALTGLGSAHGAVASKSSPATIAQLELRLRALEDREEIQNLLAASPFSSDIPSVAFQEGMYVEDAIMNSGGAGSDMRGREAVVDTIRVPNHLAAVESGMAHFAGLPHIRIDGDRAVATGYLAILVSNPDGPKVPLGQYAPASGLMIWRVTANRWELARTAQGWKMTKRVIRAAPGPETRELLKAGIDPAR
jgi:hypothetical protein